MRKTPKLSIVWHRHRRPVQPLRGRVQRVVDRRFNRARFDADRVATGFAGRIRDQVEVATVIGAFGEAIDRTVQPSSAVVWIRGDAR